MIASYDTIEPEKSDIVWAGFQNWQLCSGWYLLQLLLLFAILRHEGEVISNVLLASGNNIHSSCDESEHEADDYDDGEEEEGERNLPDATYYIKRGWKKDFMKRQRGKKDLIWK
jgi:hypothetical protein